MELAVDITVELIVRTISEGHPAAGTSEASLMPVPSSILVVEIDTLGDGLVATSADQIRSSLGVSSTVRTTITDAKGTLKKAITLCAAEVVLMPDFSEGIDLGTLKNGLATLGADITARSPALGAEVLTDRVEVLLSGKGLVTFTALEMFLME